MAISVVDRRGQQVCCEPDARDLIVRRLSAGLKGLSYRQIKWGSLLHSLLIMQPCSHGWRRLAPTLAKKVLGGASAQGPHRSIVAL